MDVLILSLKPGILGILRGLNGKRLCQGGKPGTGKLNTDVHTYLYGSTHTSGCMVNGLGAMVVLY